MATGANNNFERLLIERNCSVVRELGQPANGADKAPSRKLAGPHKRIDIPVSLCKSAR